MNNREISRQIQRLRNLINRVDSACGEDIEIQSHWAKYICVLSAGLLENAIKKIYIEYATAQVSQPVAKFVASKLSQIRNPKALVFMEIASAFNANWKDELENFLQDEGRGDAIDSIINNRHLIAHGREEDSSVTISRLKDWTEKVSEVLEFIEGQCQR